MEVVITPKIYNNRQKSRC